MSTNPQCSENPHPTPTSHWFTKSPDAEAVPHEMIISESQAICEAFAKMGPEATNEEVSRYLHAKGLQIQVECIDRMRANMPACAETLVKEKM